MLYIFPDTNIFIHGRHFEEIDWPALTGAPDITIMIAPSVIVELDKHKYHTNKKIAQRARKLLPRIEEIIRNPTGCQWKLAAILRRPDTTIFENNHLDSRDQDDVLLASILEFREGIGNEDQAILITNDTGPRLKAVSLNVTARSLPENYMMPDEPDESEKKITLLQKELAQHKNKIPVVALQFEKGGQHLEVPRPFDAISCDAYVAKQMEQIRNQFPPMVFREDNAITLPNGHLLKSPLFFSVRVSQVNDYNSELQAFFNEYEKYYTSEYEQMIFLHHCCPVSILVKNTGTVPAEDLDIQMHFPDGFDVIKEDHIPGLIEKPSPPYKPKNALDVQMPIVSIEGLSSLYSKRHPAADFSHFNTNVGSPSIKKTNSYDVTVHVRSVKHHQSESLDKVWLKYEDMRKAKGFTIDYRIMAANIPQVVTGQLQVNFVNGKS